MDYTRAAVWEAMGRPERVLVVDDRIPDQSLGSGFGRMLDCLTALTGCGRYHVAFHATISQDGDSVLMGRLGVEVVEGSLEEHLLAPGVYYEHLVVSRPHNAERVGALLRERLPRARLVYDAEAMYYRRLERQAAFAEGAERVALAREAVVMRARELEVVAQAEDVVCISEQEAALIRPHTRARVAVVDPWLAAPVLTAGGFRERAHLGFVAGWLAGPSSPNADGLLWFVRHVLPLVHTRVPWAKLLVTGAAPPPNVLRLAGPNVMFVGGLPDLHAFYRSIRVIVVPIRYGAGVKLKTVEALQHGVPTVATRVGAEGIDEAAVQALVVSDDPVVLAEAIAQLVDEPAAWARRRKRIEAASGHWTGVRRGVTWPDVLASGDHIDHG